MCCIFLTNNLINDDEINLANLLLNKIIKPPVDKFLFWSLMSYDSGNEIWIMLRWSRRIAVFVCSKQPKYKLRCWSFLVRTARNKGLKSKHFDINYIFRCIENFHFFPNFFSTPSPKSLEDAKIHLFFCFFCFVLFCFVLLFFFQGPKITYNYRLSRRL